MRQFLLALIFALGSASTPLQALETSTNGAIQQLVDDGEDERAFEFAKDAARSGDAVAHEWLGWFYDQGRGTEANPDLALKHYEIAIAGGQNYARWRVGVMIDTGEAPGALERAVELFTLAANDGHTDAMTSLAVMHATGRGTPTDYEASLENYMKAARLGNPHGAQGVGVLFALGQGVELNVEEAAAWFLVAADLGNEAGQGNFDRIANGMPAHRIAFVVKRAEEIAASLGVDLKIVFDPDAPAK